MQQKFLIRTLKYFIIFIFIICLGWKVYTFLNSKIEINPVNIQVVDASTNLPIKDASIISKWVVKKRVFAPRGYLGFPDNKFFIKAKSDKEGRFNVPGFKKKFPLGQLSYGLSYSQDIFVYAPGYSYFRFGKSYFPKIPLKDFYLVKLTPLKDIKDQAENRSILLRIEIIFFEYLYYLEEKNIDNGSESELIQDIEVLVSNYQDFYQHFPDLKEWTIKHIDSLQKKIETIKQKSK